MARIPRVQCNRRAGRKPWYTLRINRAADGTETAMLHDNTADPYQLKDVAAERPEVVQELREKELRPWLEKTGDPWLKK